MSDTREEAIDDAVTEMVLDLCETGEYFATLSVCHGHPRCSLRPDEDGEPPECPWCDRITVYRDGSSHPAIGPGNA